MAKISTILKNYLAYFQSIISRKKKAKKDKDDDPFIYPHF
jgi:hypothetical protein